MALQIKDQTHPHPREMMEITKILVGWEEKDRLGYPPWAAEWERTLPAAAYYQHKEVPVSAGKIMAGLRTQADSPLATKTVTQ